MQGSPVKPMIRELRTTGHWPTLLSAFVYFDVSFMIWVLIGALGVFIAQDFNLSATLQINGVPHPFYNGVREQLTAGLMVLNYVTVPIPPISGQDLGALIELVFTNLAASSLRWTARFKGYMAPMGQKNEGVEGGLVRG